MRLTGPFVIMIYKMIMGDIVTFTALFIILLLGFSSSFYFLYKNAGDGITSMNNFIEALYISFQFSLGGFNVSWFLFANFIVLFSYKNYFVFISIKAPTIRQKLIHWIYQNRFCFFCVLDANFACEYAHCNDGKYIYTNQWKKWKTMEETSKALDLILFCFKK